MTTPSPLLDAAAALLPTATERTNAVVAAVAMATPAWEPGLKLLSGEAAALLPVLGCVWLVVQIIARITESRSRAAKRKGLDVVDG